MMVIYPSDTLYLSKVSTGQKISLSDINRIISNSCNDFNTIITNKLPIPLLYCSFG